MNIGDKVIIDHRGINTEATIFDTTFNDESTYYTHITTVGGINYLVCENNGVVESIEWGKYNLLKEAEAENEPHECDCPNQCNVHPLTHLDPL